MNKLLFIVLLCIVHVSFAQNFNDVRYSSDYSNYFYHIMEDDNYYLLTGNQTDSNEVYYNSIYKTRPIYIKISKSGDVLNIFNSDTMGYNEEVFFTIGKGGVFYTFGNSFPENNKSSLYVIKRDSNFNQIQKKYSSQTFGSRIGYIAKYQIDDSIITFTAVYHDAYNQAFYSSIIKYNLSSMEIVNYHNFVTPMIACDFDIDTTYRIFSRALNKYGAGIMLTYDSMFTLISQDTLFYNDTNANYPMDSHLSHMRYCDTLNIISGVGSFVVNNYTPNLYVIDALTIQILDSNFNVIDDKAWHYDSLSTITTPPNNGLVKNDNNEFFVGGHIRSIITPKMEDVIMVVKLDSNLNTIWKKILKGNGSEELYDMHTTSDGGVLLLYSELDSSITNYTKRIMNLKKIGPNGEVTSIIDFQLPVCRLSVDISPNPTTDKLSVSLLSPKEIISELQIFDMQGKQIIFKSIGAQQTKIDVSKLAGGAYIIKGISTAGESFRAKFIKK